MIQSKKINIIVAVAVIFAMATSIAFVVLGNMQAKNGDFKSEPEYANKVFGTDIISIEINVDPDDWQDMLDNAINEQYIMVDVVVNGTKFQNVGIRPKGNSSLTQVASSDSDRYSFRLQFDEYIKDQTCFGLESFVLNNMLGDNTYMKEYISYDLMREAGVDAPYFGFADIKVNGENWGLYLAVELYNDSYEQRVFGDTSGMLYNVKSMDMGGNPPGQQGVNPPAMPNMPDAKNNRPQIPDDASQQSPEPQQGAGGQQRPAVPQGFEGQQRSEPPQGPETQQGLEPQQGEEQQRPELQQGTESPQGAGGQQRPEAPQGFEGHQRPESQQGSEAQQGPKTQQKTEVQQNSQDNTDNTGDQPFSPLVGNDMPGFNPPFEADRTMIPGQMGGMNNMERNFGGRGGPGSSGGSLEYIDDNIESYSAIFNNVVGKGTESDYKRVVQAIKALSEGEELEKYFDVDKILRYLAAHTIVVNLDSYSSNMAQNYYIYEREGKITILPWDYNLAWGGFQNGSASSVINFPIDTPVSGVEMSSRPLIDKLFANSEYLERYHSYLQQLIDNYFANGKFEEKINALDALISDYVKNDATAFCTYEEYKTAVSTFITLGNLRAQSVQGQLDGTVPSTTKEQNKNPDKLISAGDLKLSDLGSMMGGRGGNDRGFPDRMGGQDRNFIPGGMNDGIDPELISKVMDIMRQSNGEITDEVKEELLSLGLTDEQIEQLSAMRSGSFGGMERRGQRGMEQGGQNRNIPINSDARAPLDQGTRTNNLVLIVSLSLVLIAAILFAAKFKKSY